MNNAIYLISHEIQHENSLVVLQVTHLFPTYNIYQQK